MASRLLADDGLGVVVGQVVDDLRPCRFLPIAFVDVARSPSGSVSLKNDPPGGGRGTSPRRRSPASPISRSSAAELDRRVELDVADLVGPLDLVDVTEDAAFALGARDHAR